MKWLSALSLVIFCNSASEPGTIRFATRVTGLVDAPVYGANGYGPGPAANAQLYRVTKSGGAVVYTPLLPVTTFQDPGSFPLRAAYVVEPGDAVKVPDVRPGQQVTVVLRVFQGPSYDWALGNGGSYGQSNPITITLGGRADDGSEIPPAPLVGLQGFANLSAWGWRPHLLFLRNDGERIDFRVYPPTLLPSVVEKSFDLKLWFPIMTNAMGITNITVPLIQATPPTFFRLRERLN